MGWVASDFFSSPDHQRIRGAAGHPGHSERAGGAVLPCGRHPTARGHVVPQGAGRALLRGTEPEDPGQWAHHGHHERPAAGLW